MNRIKIHLVAAVMLISAFGGCGNSQKQESYDVTVSVYPIYDIARNIAGDSLRVGFMVPVGANPHNYEPSMSGVKSAQNVKLFIGVHEHFDGWIQKYIPKNARPVYLSASGLREKHTPDGDNPHIWLSVKKARVIARDMKDAFIMHAPDKRVTISSNYLVYIALLDELDAYIGEKFADLAGRSFIQWHPAWDAFASDYGLKITGTIEKGHGHEPSVRAFRTLVEKAKTDKTMAVVIGLNVENKAAQSMANEIGGRIVRLDSIGNPETKGRSTYIDMMKYNADTLAGALKSQ